MGLHRSVQPLQGLRMFTAQDLLAALHALGQLLPRGLHRFQVDHMLFPSLSLSKSLVNRLFGINPMLFSSRLDLLGRRKLCHFDT